MTEILAEGGSFKDPGGFVFYVDKTIHRQINASFAGHYESLMSSGLYNELTKAGLLIPHEDADIETPSSVKCHKIIRPAPVPFISYPYEWCFSQLKDAALATLDIQSRALKYNMTLKDASAYNIQFMNGRAVLIDTLSFVTYEEGQPWQAYRQFCEHFLAPLSIMGHKDVRLGRLLRDYTDGIPLDLAAGLLPLKTRLIPGLLANIHAHSKSQKHFGDKRTETKIRMGRRSLEGIIASLRSAVSAIKWSPVGQWGKYYKQTNYSDAAFEHKKDLIESYTKRQAPRTVWDLGANTGVFSRIAARLSTHVVSLDSDPAAVEKNHLECKENNIKNTLPLVMNLANPSPSMGWAGAERHSLQKRGPADMVLALALVHHLAISGNIPLARIAEFFAGLCHNIIVEFAPKSDSQVKRMLATREDVFGEYDEAHFEGAFKKYFEVQEKECVRDSERTIYLMVRRA